MSRATQVPADRLTAVSRTRLSRSTAPLSSGFRYLCHPAPPPVLQPRAVPRDIPGLGSSAFARHYLRNHCYFLFLRVLRCFSSPRSPQLRWWRDRSRRVPPFGHPRITVHLPLRAAFRSLSRPSSPPRATGIPRAPFLAFLFSLRLFFRLCARFSAAFRGVLACSIALLRLPPHHSCLRLGLSNLRSHHVNDLCSCGE